MKFAIVVLCLLPLVFAEKRFLFDDIINTGEIRHLVDTVVGQFGTDATEQQCEQECVTISKSAIFDTGCDVLCLSFQSLVKQFYHPATTAAPAA